MDRKKVSISLLLPEAMDEQIKKLAADTHRSKSGYIRQILRRYLRYLETKENLTADPVDWDIQ